MNLEMSRIYKDIIEEVMNKLENEGEAFNISRSVIFDLQNGWAQKIRASAEAKNENVYEHGVYRGFNSYVDIKNPEDENYDSDDYELLEEEEGSNFLMCLYVKVHRTRTKYKCSFKQGFINIGNVDFAFSNAQGELDW
ncbi:Transcription initiation factor IIA subunit 1 [Nosema bombycis CQ1]|jgi:transcription initiation factor TFIIA large subunit|uniref:Transcription initiation factor IIA subunit 1 n=1 Tax=Nosema bombycis (strain CQ1 / CVCC 102059) TaxID=578461 RepID=R0KXP9_NOSB1|nr:Transcription initiation factor IIA subunit 1 [Nosema bombycis CQ1]EOB14982.1 Transcription initiation factor IIA subunit 1 [Nosema bombycis CQ1]|eukprot:EOB14296.1 Transcription initiation factor IIA subunit 1 [Nosema bombycis CQ1]